MKKINIKQSKFDKMSKADLISLIKDLIKREEEISLTFYIKNRQGKLEQMSERIIRKKLINSINIIDDYSHIPSFSSAFNNWANKNEEKFKKTIDNYFYYKIGVKYQ